VSIIVSPLSKKAIMEHKEKEPKICQQSESFKTVSWLNSQVVWNTAAAIISLIKISIEKQEQEHMLEKLGKSAEQLEGILHKINKVASANGSA
jgi:hypothetical protein